MSKIDEIIDDIKFNNWVANEFIIEELEQLRPYVELGELMYRNVEALLSGREIKHKSKIYAKS